MRTKTHMSPSHWLSSIILSGALLASSLNPTFAQQAWTAPADGFPQTPAELSNFESPTGHLEMWGYLDALRGVSTEMRLGTYGKSWEGRDLPYAVYSRPLVSEPWEAWALGRPIVLLAANVHGGERTFRNSHHAFGGTSG